MLVKTFVDPTFECAIMKIPMYNDAYGNGS